MVPAPLPLAGPMAIPRLAFRVKLTGTHNVPPLITILPGVAEAGTAPMLMSAETLNAPAVMVVVPL
jgi:hypothetical protein